MISLAGFSFIFFRGDRVSKNTSLLYRVILVQNYLWCYCLVTLKFDSLLVFTWVRNWLFAKFPNPEDQVFIQSISLGWIVFSAAEELHLPLAYEKPKNRITASAVISHTEVSFPPTLPLWSSSITLDKGKALYLAVLGAQQNVDSRVDGTNSRHGRAW